MHTVHDGHKDYKCESCGKEFAQKIHLKNHTLSVHENKKYAKKKSPQKQKCEICFEWFCDKRSLKGHIEAVHEKKKLYECDTCGKRILNPFH